MREDLIKLHRLIIWDVVLKHIGNWCLFSIWYWWKVLGLLKQSPFQLWLLDKILILDIGPLIILLTLKNSLEPLINVEKSLGLLRTPQVLSYLFLVVWSLICILLDPHLCGFRVLVILTNFRVTRYFPVLTCTYSQQGSQTYLWAMLDTFPIFCPHTYDDLFYSDFILV